MPFYQMIDSVFDAWTVFLRNDDSKTADDENSSSQINWFTDLKHVTDVQLGKVSKNKK